MIPGRGVSLPGVGIWKERNGKTVFQKWPRKQAVARTPDEAANRHRLDVATQIVPYMDAYQQDFARQVSEITQLAVRDLLYVSLFGRLGYLVNVNGKMVFSMAAMQDVSRTLDAIYQLKNGILVRGETYWQGLAPGAAGRVLTVQLDGSLGWNELAPSGVSEGYKLVPPLVPDVASNAVGGDGFFGRPIMPQTSDTLTGVRVWIHATSSGATIAPGLYAGAASGHGLAGGALVRNGAAQAVTVGLMSLPFATPVTLTPNNWYWFGPRIIAPSNIDFANNPQLGFIELFNLTGGALPATAPAVGSGSFAAVGWWLY